MNDPFNSTRLPAKFDRACRIELIGRPAPTKVRLRNPTGEWKIGLIVNRFADATYGEQKHEATDRKNQQ